MLIGLWMEGADNVPSTKSFSFRLPKIKEYVDKNDSGAVIIPFSGAFELALTELQTEEERKKYCDEHNCQRYR